MEARAAYLLRFAQEAFVALSERDFYPIEVAGREDRADT